MSISVATTTLRACSIACLSAVVYGLCLVVYRLCFHPLRSYPGPKLAAATYWYECFFDVLKSPQGQYLYEIDRLHEIYGPVVRINPDLLHVKDSRFFDVFVTGRRDRWGIKPTGERPLSSTNSHDLHRLRRTPLNPFFSKRATSQLGPIVHENIRHLCHRLTEYASSGKVVDLEAVFTALKLDTITKYAFDISYGCLEAPDFAPEWGRTMKGLFDAVPMGRLSPGLARVMRGLPLSITRRIKPDMVTFIEGGNKIRSEAIKVHNEYSSASKRKSLDQSQQKTVFHSLMYSNLPDEEKAIHRISDEAYVLIVAGTHTTARVLVYIFYYLATNKTLLADVRAALQAVNISDLSETHKLEQVPLLKAIIQEALRISAPLSNRLALVAETEPLTCKDYTFPPGTPISMTFRDVLYDSEVFPSPDTLDLYRWIRASEAGVRLEKYMVAFSKGSRICLGMNLAYAELYAATAALVLKFDMELFETVKERDLDFVRDAFMALPSKDARGVRVKISTRDV